MRLLWQGGDQSHHGEHYTVENARLYTLPDEPPPVYVSAFGPKAVSVAARIGDGLVTTAPQAELVEQYRSEGGKGPVLGGPKACWAPDEETARKLAFELWPNMGLPGELAQELATPAHFEQACELVREEDALGSLPLGPDPEVHAEIAPPIRRGRFRRDLRAADRPRTGAVLRVLPRRSSAPSLRRRCDGHRR